MYCRYCKKEVDALGRFCPNCGMPFEEDVWAAPTEQDTNYSKERRAKARDRLNPINVSQPTNSYTNTSYTQAPAAKANTGTSRFSAGRTKLLLADGEVIVKQYLCANVVGAQGYLTVTNKRLLFNAFSGSGDNRLSQEVTLSSVSGISCYYGNNYLLRRIIIGIILVILGVCVMGVNEFDSGVLSFLGIILIIAGIGLILLGIRKSFLIAIYAKDVSLSPIVVGEGPTSLLGNNVLLTLTSQRTSDTDKMINEIGALIQDLQTLGDLAIEKWQNMLDFRDLPTI